MLIILFVLVVDLVVKVVEEQDNIVLEALLCLVRLHIQLVLVVVETLTNHQVIMEEILTLDP